MDIVNLRRHLYEIQPSCNYYQLIFYFCDSFVLNGILSTAWMGRGEDVFHTPFMFHYLSKSTPPFIALSSFTAIKRNFKQIFQVATLYELWIRYKRSMTSLSRQLESLRSAVTTQLGVERSHASILFDKKEAASLYAEDVLKIGSLCFSVIRNLNWTDR